MSSTAWPLAGGEVIKGDEEKLLIERAKRDGKALGELYLLHYPTIFRFVHRRVGESHDADDIVADVFLSMVKNLHRFRYRGIPFRAWLFRLATTQLSRWARRRRRWAVQQLCDMSKHEDPRIDEGTQLDSELVEIVLLTLPPRLQTVLTLHYLEEMKVKEMAEVMKCGSGTVKSRLSRGRELTVRLYQSLCF